jgi:drug/metabolite transporter (DMT)-like permease
VLFRLLIGAAVLVAWMRLRGERLPRGAPVVRRLAALGSINVLGAFVLITWGQQFVASSYAAILVATGPIFSSVGASLVLPDEPLDLRRAMGVTVGFAGVAALFAGDLGGNGVNGHSALEEIAGAAAIVVGAVIVASVAIAVRLRVRELSAVQIALPQVLAGTVTVAVLMTVVAASGAGSFRFDPWSPGVLVGLLALGIFNAGLGNIVYYRLILSWGVTRTALVGYSAPFIGAAVGATLLDERLGLPALVGLLLITASLVWVNRHGVRLAATTIAGRYG